MNTLFTSRLNGIFILNTLLELHKPVTVSELAGIINHRYDHVTAPQKKFLENAKGLFVL